MAGRTTDYGLRTMDYGLRTTDYGLWTMGLWDHGPGKSPAVKCLGWNGKSSPPAKNRVADQDLAYWTKQDPDIQPRTTPNTRNKWAKTHFVIHHD